LIAETGYKRIRKDGDGTKKQRLEIRFGGLSGCLRTPRGGSSRQIVVLVDGVEVKTRLLTIKEAARLMGLRDSYKLPDVYNEAYMALGDAVAVPVTTFWRSIFLQRSAGKRLTNGFLTARRYRMSIDKSVFELLDDFSREHGIDDRGPFSVMVTLSRRWQSLHFPIRDNDDVKSYGRGSKTAARDARSDYRRQCFGTSYRSKTFTCALRRKNHPQDCFHLRRGVGRSW